MLKDQNLMHKVNKNFLFFVGLLIVLSLLLILAWQNKGRLTDKLKPIPDQTQPIDEVLVGGANDKLPGIKPLRPIDETDHAFGSIDAPVKIIVYDDFECSFCGDYYDTLERVRKDFNGKVVIAFRHYPLSDIHAMALPAALASECAAEQGKFEEMYHKLFAENKANRMNPDQFKQDAVELGLDGEQFSQCLDSEKYKDKVLGQTKEGSESNVTGTPTTFIDGEIVIGNNPYEDVITDDGSRLEGLKSIITRHLSK